MLSTNVPLKCNKGRTLAKPYFQYPTGKSPGDFDPLPPSDISYLQSNSLAHWIFVEILPVAVGITIFTFFLISSSFIVYGVIRGFYTDRMLPRRKKILKKLGKLPEEKRRKHFRRSKRKHTSHDKISRRSTLTSERSYGAFLTAGNAYSDDFEPVVDPTDPSDDQIVVPVLSYTTPPLNIEKNSPLPTVAKPLHIPGSPFPVLPHPPIKSKNAATSPLSLQEKLRRKSQ